MDPLDHLLLRELEKGLPLVPYPYGEIGARLEMSEEDVIQRIGALKNTGIIRRMRARINQREVGIVANALVAWKIPENETDPAGLLLAEFQEVTHCYRRSTIPGRWDFTIYTVHHGWSHKQVLQEIAMIAEKIGHSEYCVLFSTEEYKRTPHTKVDDLGEIS